MHEEMEIQPAVIATDEILNYVGKYERYCHQYPIIMKYLKKKINNRRLDDFFKSINANKVVLYAVTEFTDLVIEELLNENEQMIYAICDRAADKFSGYYKNCRVINIDDMITDYKNNCFDKIVVCSIFHEKEIIDEFCDKEIPLDDVVTVIQAIYWM